MCLAPGSISPELPKAGGAAGSPDTLQLASALPVELAAALISSMQAVVDSDKSAANVSGAKRVRAAAAAAHPSLAVAME